MPGFYVRDRPDRASPRKTKKAGDFPARKPGEPSVTTVTRRIESTCSNPGTSPKSKAIGPWTAPVQYRYNEKLDLFFLSMPDTNMFSTS